MEINDNYMRHALQLAAQGRGNVSPNPMVGAVIVHEDKIIGQGYHRQYGGPHAEVNAVNSVRDRSLLPHSTIYVTLEPCSHYGKTPPCSKLIIESKIPRVVVGATDPFDKVAGRGIKMLRDAGIEVATGILAQESMQLNARFFTAHTLRRPFISLKWAQSSDGYMDIDRTAPAPAAKFSNAVTTQTVHAMRAMHDAILTSAATVNADNPSLTVRHWVGHNPSTVILQRNTTIIPTAKLLKSNPLIVDGKASLQETMEKLYTCGITSLLVEAGSRLLKAFLENDLWDAARVEISPLQLNDRGTHPAPVIPRGLAIETSHDGGNIIINISNNKLYIPQSF